MIINYPALSLIASAPMPVVGQEPCSDDEVSCALQRILTSRQFSKAHRCTALLAYLVQRVLNRDDSSSPPEHEIGVAVFGRDRMTYYTSDDPIVRVQAGRLRLRLAAYYAEEGRDDGLRISIPLGTYRPQITLAEVRVRAPAARQIALLTFRPLACLSTGPLVAGYALGLNEEVGYRLYRDLNVFRRLDIDATRVAPTARSDDTHLLEGSIRQEAERVRVSLLLRRGDDGTVVWYEQFDDAADVSIAAQEKMAERCVQALRRQLSA